MFGKIVVACCLKSINDANGAALKEGDVMDLEAIKNRFHKAGELEGRDCTDLMAEVEKLFRKLELSKREELDQKRGLIDSR